MKKDIWKLIEENKNLIYKIAHSYSGCANMDDLFQVGCIGIINAYKNYNDRYNTKFSTYAYNYILGEITNYLKSDRLLKMHGDNSKIYKLYEKAKDYLTSHNGYTPSKKEISEFMGVSEEIIDNAINNHSELISIDSEVKDDLYLHDLIGEDNRNQIDTKIDLSNVIDTLNEQDKELINYRYYQDFTQSETASLMGMSQVQVSRRENKILSKIKSEITM
jgi:RNA polymerase sporulation-specific sigma factor